MHNNLKALLIKNGWKYSDLAEYIGIATTTLSDKINGKAKFDIDEVEKIKSLFGLPYESIFFNYDVLEKRNDSHTA